MRNLLKALCLIIVAGVCGFAGFRTTVSEVMDTGSVYDDFILTESGWLFSDRIGAASASGLERAKVAIGGPLGLSAKEAVYFIAITDNEGRSLRSTCTYSVTGPKIDTRWWSLTLYDTETQHYVPNSINRSSWNSVSVPRDEDGNWTLTVSQDEAPVAWLPSQVDDDKTFELNLRVYNPSDQTRAILPNIALPVVEQVSC